MEIVWSLNRSWIYDTYFSLYRAIHSIRGESPGEMSGRNVRGEMSGYLVKYSPRLVLRQCRSWLYS